VGPVENVLEAVERAGTDVVLHLPCVKIAPLLDALTHKFRHIPLTREEEGVGVAAGAHLAGARPLMAIQNSGLGNMVNALMSLTKFYSMPLPIFVSQRGVYDEKIQAQVPMGTHTVPLLDTLGIEHVTYEAPDQLDDLPTLLSGTFEDELVRCFLFSPTVWQGSPRQPQTHTRKECPEPFERIENVDNPKPRLEAIEGLAPFLRDKAVICNMGAPSRELFSTLDQPSNFYMLGSLGLVSSIGLGVSLFTKREVVVIDGDGSLLMNPNALTAIGAMQPRNLTVVCLDNGTYGSTGDQPTWAGCGLDMEGLAKAAGIGRILVTADPEHVMELDNAGPTFVRLAVEPGNAPVGNVTLPPLEMKQRFMSWLRD